MDTNSSVLPKAYYSEGNKNLRSAEAAVSRTIQYAYHAAKRDRVNRTTQYLLSSQWQSREEINRLQQEKLAALLTYAQINNPYYRPLLPEGPIAPQDAYATLKSLPYLTKNIIRTRLPELRSPSVSDHYLERNSTSGSTGEPLKFFVDVNSSNCRKATDIRSNGWAGCPVGERQGMLWGSPIDQTRASALRGRVHGYITRVVHLSAYRMNPEQMARYATTLKEYRPVLLTAYPSALETFARFLARSHAEAPKFPSIIVSAETLFPYQRDLFEQVFGSEIFNRYGCREIGGIAQECSAHNGLHVNAERVFVEILDDYGNPCPPGQFGNVFATDLDNYGMPFLRYQIGDRAAWSSRTGCACGRGLPVLSAVEGRSMDVIRCPNGNLVGGTFWTILLREKPGIDAFQVIQDSIDQIDIRYLATRELAPEVQTFFTKKIVELCGSQMRVKFLQVPALKSSPSGKRRIITSHIEELETAVSSSNARPVCP